MVLDYETEPIINLTITVSDPSVVSRYNSATSNVTVRVVDGNDAPTSLSVSGHELRSGEAGAVVGRINVVDQDTPEEFRFSVSDTRFVVDGSVLRLRDGQSVSSEQEPTLNMMVTVTDKGGAVLAETVTINVINDTPFRNPRDPFDVDNDGHVYPRDALILVNQLNQRGSHILTPMTASGEDGVEIYFLDVNGDGILSPLDALILINHLNQRSNPAINNGNGTPNGNNGASTSTQSESNSDVEAELDPTIDNTHSLAEGEGEGADSELACPAWMPVAQDTAYERTRREAIDSELELLVDQLSRARLS